MRKARTLQCCLVLYTANTMKMFIPRLLTGLLAISLLPSLAQPKAVSVDLPLPKRCHLVAPCGRGQGCQPDLDSKEIYVQGRIAVQLGVACLSASGSRAYGTDGFFTYTIWEEGISDVFATGKFSQYDMSLRAHLSGMVSTVDCSSSAYPTSLRPFEICPSALRNDSFVLTRLPVS